MSKMNIIDGECGLGLPRRCRDGDEYGNRQLRVRQSINH